MTKRTLYEVTYININNRITREEYSTKEEATKRLAEAKEEWTKSQWYKKVAYYAMLCTVTRYEPATKEA